MFSSSFGEQSSDAEASLEFFDSGEAVMRWKKSPQQVEELQEAVAAPEECGKGDDED